MFTCNLQLGQGNSLLKNGSYLHVEYITITVTVFVFQFILYVAVDREEVSEFRKRLANCIARKKFHHAAFSSICEDPCMQ